MVGDHKEMLTINAAEFARLCVHGAVCRLVKLFLALGDENRGH